MKCFSVGSLRDRISAMRHRTPVSQRLTEAGAMSHARFEQVRFEPAQFEPARLEPARFEPVRFEPARVKPVRFKPVRIDPVRFEPYHWLQDSATGTRTRVARVRAEYPNQLDYSGS